MRELLLHGGALDLMKARFPDAPTPWIDLSTGINPWSYEYAVDDRLSAQHLPTDAQFDACSRAMASAFRTDAGQLLLAPGSELLIRLLPTILSARRVCVAARSYGDHARVWRDAGVELTEAMDPLAVVDECDVVVVCNPNNPDGRRWSRAQLSDARQRLAASSGWLIVDEAYMDLDPEQSMLREQSTDGLIVLRSFGKFFGLAGVRLGALYAPRSVLDAMARRLGVWSVSGPTLAIGAEAYVDHAWQARTRRHLESARAALDEVLLRRGLEVVGGTDLFRFVQTENAEDCWLKLAAQGIYTRRFDGIERSLRIGLPASDIELSRLDDALARISLSG